MLDARSKRLESQARLQGKGAPSSPGKTRILVNGDNGTDIEGDETRNLVNGGDGTDTEGDEPGIGIIRDNPAAFRGPAKIGEGGCVNLPRLQQALRQHANLDSRKYKKRIHSTPHLNAAGVSVEIEPFLLKAGHKGAKIKRALFAPSLEDYTLSQRSWADIIQ